LSKFSIQNIILFILFVRILRSVCGRAQYLWKRKHGMQWKVVLLFLSEDNMKGGMWQMSR